MDKILNRIDESGLIQLDLAKFKPKVDCVGIDISDQLYMGLILKENEFRLWLKQHDWNEYTNKGVFVFCSADAIIPTWSYMLITSKLIGLAHTIVCGTQEDLEKQLVKDSIESLDSEQFRAAKIIIKGCSDISCPEFAMSELIKKLQSTANSIMYGEPCSTVPIFKRKITK